MLCLWQEQEEAKPEMENRDQTWAKRSCWVPQEWAPHRLLLSWVAGRQTQTDSPTTGAAHRWVSLVPFAKVLIASTNWEGGRGN